MAYREHYRRAMVILWYKVALLVVIAAILLTGIIYVGSFYSYMRTQWKTMEHVFVLMFTGIFVLLTVETGMLILLVKAIKQKSFTKSRLWVALSFVFFLSRLIVFIIEAFSLGWTSVDTILVIELFLQIVCVNVMYDYMVEVRGRRQSDTPPAVPMSPLPNIPPMVDIPLTTFKTNDLNVPYSYSNWNSPVANL